VSLFQVLYSFFNDFVFFLIENGIGTPKEFLILAFLGFGITSFSLVNWPTLLVVMLMVGSNSACLSYILHFLLIELLCSTQLLQIFKLVSIFIC